MTIIKAQLGIQELDIPVQDGGMLKSCLTQHGRESLQGLLTEFTDSARIKYASLDIEGEVLSVGVEQAIEPHLRQDMREEFTGAVQKIVKGLLNDYVENGSAIDYSQMPGGGNSLETPAPRRNPDFDHRIPAIF